MRASNVLWHFINGLDIYSTQRVYQFPIAAIRNCHRPIDLKQHSFSFLQLCKLEPTFIRPKSRCRQGKQVLKAQSGENLFPCHFSLLVAACMLWLMDWFSISKTHHFSLFPLSHHLFFFCSQISLYFSLIRILVINWANSDNAR